VIEGSKLEVELAISQGLDSKASSLVLQRLYPTRWTSPKVYKAGDKLTLPLEGFETAVYELFPLADATEPLLAGAVFDMVGQENSAWKVSVHSVAPEARILNPSVLKSAAEASRSIRTLVDGLNGSRPADLVKGVTIDGSQGEKGSMKMDLTVGGNLSDAMVAVLLAQDNSTKVKVPLKVAAQVDGLDAAVSTEYQEGKSQWYKIAVTPGKHTVSLTIAPAKDSLTWRGKATLWFVSRQKQNSKAIELVLNQMPTERSLPPTVWPAGEVRKNVKLGEVKLSTPKPK
jgi:hypothetical protein